MMNSHLNSIDYTNLVDDILEHKEFLKLADITHHGSNRYDHSVRVSYWSYKVGRFLKLDYQKIARAALLHDFFFEDNGNLSYKQKTINLVKHPEYALENAKKHFELSKIEEDIILTHMFPFSFKLPKYFESWMVNIIDDVIAVYEKTYVVRKQLSAAVSFMMIFLLNYIR